MSYEIVQYGGEGGKVTVGKHISHINLEKRCLNLAILLFIGMLIFWGVGSLMARQQENIIKLSTININKLGQSWAKLITGLDETVD